MRNIFKKINRQKKAMVVNKPCYLCGKSDWQTYPVIIPKIDFDDTVEWICRRHMDDGWIEVNAFTGMPIFMVGKESIETNSDA